MPEPDHCRAHDWCRHPGDTAFGIRLSALGARWFTASAPMPQGLYFPGCSAADANPALGDSAIVETLGFAAFASSEIVCVSSTQGLLHRGNIFKGY